LFTARRGDAVGETSTAIFSRRGDAKPRTHNPPPKKTTTEAVAGRALLQGGGVDPRLDPHYTRNSDVTGPIPEYVVPGSGVWVVDTIDTKCVLMIGDGAGKKGVQR
jgi:hypothetical protein